MDNIIFNNELRTRLAIEQVILLRDPQMSMSYFETLLASQCRAFHQPGTRINECQNSQDGYSSKVGQDNYLLGHAEGYYRPVLPPPDVCIFWCQSAPKVTGGETFWIDGSELYQALPYRLAQRLDTEGVIYEATWPIQRWQAEFRVADILSLRQLLDTDTRCRYELSSEGELHLFFKTNPIMTGSDGVKRFINGMLAHLPEIKHPRYQALPVYYKTSNKIHWGNGGLICHNDINQILDAHDALLHKHRWMDSDVLLLNNHYVLHGRVNMSMPSERVIFSRFGYWK